MRFTPFFLVAPALLAAAQQTSVLHSVLTGAGATSSASSSGASISSMSTSSGSPSSSSSSSSSSAVASSSSSSSDDNDSNTPDDLVTRTFNGGQATLFTNANGIVGTGFGAAEVISTLRDHRDWGTLVSSVPATTYTTTGKQKHTDLAAALSSGNPALKTVTFNGGQATLITDDNGIVATAHGAAEVISELRDHRDWGTLVSSVPATTYTTSKGIPSLTADSDSDNAAPAATAAPMIAGGIIGAGMVVVGLL